LKGRKKYSLNIRFDNLKFWSYCKLHGMYSTHDIQNALLDTYSVYASREAIHRWLTGKSSPSLGMYVYLCKLLGVSLDEFILEEKRPPDIQTERMYS